MLARVRLVSLVAFPQRIRLLPLAIFLILCTCNLQVFAQSLTDVLGIPPDAALYPIPGVGSVNLKTGNLHIQIPIRAVNDRNGTPLTTSIQYDTSIWQVIQVPGTNGNPVSVWTAGTYQGADAGVFETAVGVSTSPNYSSSQVTWTQPALYKCGNASIPFYEGWQYTDGNGTIHPFPPASYTEYGKGTGCPDVPTLQAAATDHSGYWLEVTNYNYAIVYDKHGNIVTSGGPDTNGNRESGFADKLGRSLQLPSTFTYTYKTIYVWTQFGAPGVAELGPLSVSVLSSLTLPGGRVYSFKYDDAGPPAGPNGTYEPSQQGHYGNLTGITLPTGGQITIASQQLPASQAFYPAPYAINQVATPDGTWSFTYSPTTYLITATAPVNPDTGLASQTTYSLSFVSPNQVQTVSTYSGNASGTPLLQVTTTNPGATPTSIATTSGGLTSSVAYTCADACTPRVATKKEYDFSAKLLRETDVSYLTSTGDNSLLCNQDIIQTPTWSTPYLKGAHHITDIPQSVTVYGPSGPNGPILAQTNYTYDSTSLSTTSGSLNKSVLGLSIHDDTDFGTSMVVRGNPTVISQMTVPGTFITTSTRYYNILGELVKAVDGDNNVINYDYSDSWQDASCAPSPLFAYVTTTKNALGQLTTKSYNSCDGSVASVQDQNDINASRAGTTYSYDGLQRITSVSYPDGGQTTTSYGGSALPEVITTTTLATPDPSIISTTTLDGLGRPVQSALTSDPSGTTYVKTAYSLGRVQSVTNPYRQTTDPTYGSTAYTYDALGRKTKEVEPDGTSTQNWAYSGNLVTYSDEDGNQWQQTSDPLGRLTTVLEPSGSSTTPYLETDYSYDALNNLLALKQWGGPSGTSGSKVRSFAYDGLSRLLAANNPERSSSLSPPQLTCSGLTGTWTDCYSYDAASNVTKKTDNRNISTTFSYDALNRITQKLYSDTTPSATFTYDTPGWGYLAQTSPSEPAGAPVNVVGRLAVEETLSGSTVLTGISYSYDPLGRVAIESRCTPSTCAKDEYDMHYVYDLAGNVTYAGRGLLDGANHTAPNSGYYYGGIKLTYNGTTQPLNVTSDLPVNASPLRYDVATSLSYSPLGGIASVGIGDEFMQTSTYSKRGWLQQRNSTDFNGNQTLMDTINHDAHGNVQNVSDTITGEFVYCYDTLNRLLQVVGPLSGSYSCPIPFTPYSGSMAATQYGYDAFGTLDSRSVSSGSGYQFSFTANSHNQDPGRSYDAAGNLLNDGVHTYTYDAESRIISVVDQNTQYFYDAEGNRAATGVKGQTAETDFLYDKNGTLVTTVGTTTFTMVRSSLYAAGQHWGDFKGTGGSGTTTEFRLGDEVGTLLYDFDQNGNLLNQCASGPFGESLACNPATDFTETHFADKKRDQESNLDYSGARYYSSTMGRFMSPDPSGLAYADQTNPQSLNLYAYALNNPLKYTDPTGLYCYYGDTNANSADWGDDSQYDMHSTQSECTAKDENGNRGTWFNDPSTTVNVNADGSSSTIDTTLPTSNAYITPVAQPARDKLLSTLSNANPCWAFFNAATSSSGMGSPGQTFANTDVRLDPSAPVSVGGHTEQGSGSNGPIFINPNSAFSHGTVTMNGRPTDISIGPFKGGTNGAQEGILAHEFGHKTNAIPSDSASVNQSWKNTDTVNHYCANQF